MRIPTLPLRLMFAVAAISAVVATNCNDGLTLYPDVEVDDKPPATITDLRSSSYPETTATVILTWTAPGDDGHKGQAIRYDLRYAPDSMTVREWRYAKPLTYEEKPQPPGSTEVYTVENLPPQSTYYFAIKTVDDIGNWSAQSNVSATNLTDRTPPPPIDDLSAFSYEEETVTLTWSAPGGYAVRYEVRYNRDSLVAVGWTNTQYIPQSITPSSVGTQQSFTASNMRYCANLYFVIRSYDWQGNVSAISNVAGAYPSTYKAVAFWQSDLDYPYGIALDRDGYILVTERKVHKVSKFTTSGQLVSTWGQHGSSDGEFNIPLGIATDADGYVYVVDAGNHRIQKFTSVGEFVTKWDDRSGGQPGIARVYDVATGPDSVVYLVDRTRNKVVKFTSDGDSIMEWGKTTPGQRTFTRPQGIATDEYGNVYVADTGASRVKKFTSEGELLAEWGRRPDEKPLLNPVGIVTDPAGYVYVTNRLREPIVKYTLDGEYVTEWGSFYRSYCDWTTGIPTGLAVTPYGSVLLVSTGTYKIMEFVQVIP